MGLVISECKGLYGQLQWKGGEDCQAVEVPKHQVAVLVAAEDVVVRRDKASYAVAGRLTHLGSVFQKLSKIVCLLTKCRPLRVNTCREWLALSWPVKMTWP